MNLLRQSPLSAWKSTPAKDFRCFRLAFTLAEVLIVLGIIGIIADMTIPTLIKSYEKQIYIAQLQKFVSVFTQGMKMIIADESVNNIDETSMFDGSSYTNATRNVAIDNAIKKAFNTIQTCKYGDNSCTISGHKTLDKKITGLGIGYRFYTQDGMYINLFLDTICASSIEPRMYNINNCAGVMVDVNGKKKPNILGRDVFMFSMDKDGSIFPDFGLKYARWACGNDDGLCQDEYWLTNSSICGVKDNTDITGVRGDGCAARIMDEGWKMNY